MSSEKTCKKMIQGQLRTDGVIDPNVDAFLSVEENYLL